MVNDRNQMGDAVNLVIDSEDIPVTDKDWEEERDWVDSDFDDTKTPDRGLAKITPSGSFEYDGTKQELEQRIHEAPSNKFRLIYYNENYQRGYRISGVGIDNISHSHPGDDKSSVTVDWTGEKVVPF